EKREAGDFQRHARRDEKATLLRRAERRHQERGEHGTQADGTDEDAVRIRPALQLILRQRRQQCEDRTAEERHRSTQQHQAQQARMMTEVSETLSKRRLLDRRRRSCEALAIHRSERGEDSDERQTIREEAQLRAERWEQIRSERWSDGARGVEQER